ncbi:multidrug RND transporter [Galactobacter valiniphilus]|uniref:Multidrug RND transporter n=1 Tax=Galactobacter valiniphilus TaxID=2676122 RepID=A0A399J8Q0_9MICC|nr:MMPL family transporter [Galactobacter valiniphilus]RII41450.1 multidrug RND transporter [Galactobacter valiniphilus]
MASFLYRLGTLAARKRWWFLSAWLVVLLVIGGSAGAFMGKLSNSFSIPGTETQVTLDKMRQEIPELAGGQGNVVFQSKDGAFTQEQKDTIEDSLQELKDEKLVVGAIAPFSTQQTLDESADKVADGEAEIAANAKKLADGKKALAEGKQKLEDGKKQIEKNEPELAKAKAQLEDGKAQLEAGKTKLAEGQREYNSGLAQYQSGAAQLAAAGDKIAAGQKQYDAGAKQLRDGRAKLEAAEKQLAAGQKQYDAGTKEYAAGLKELEAKRPAYEQGKKQLAQLNAGLKAIAEGCKAAGPEQAQAACRDAQAEAQLGLPSYAAAQQQAAAAQKQLGAFEQGEAKLAAAKKTLADSKAKLAAGAQQIETNRAKLTAAEKELTAAKAQLDAGRAQIAEKRPQLTAAKSKLDAAAAQLASGRAEIATNEKKLADGQAKYEDGAAKLADAKKQIAEGEKELPANEAKLADGEKQLAGARTQLALGQRNADAGHGMRFVSEDGTTAVANLQFEGQAEAISPADRQKLQDTLNRVTSQGVEVLYSKEIVSDLNSFFGPGEAIGMIIAALVLFFMMGTLVAAGLPLLMAIIGVGAGVGGTLAFSSLVEMASITPALALMLGLAVGIDYSLFIMHRHRKQMLAGMPVVESIGTAVGTSGNAVVFAGLTVVIALAALVVPGLPFLSILGLSAAATVALSVLVSLTLLPAILGFLGKRMVSKRAWRKAEAAGSLGTQGAHAASGAQLPAGAAAAAAGTAKPQRGWGAFTTRHPWLIAAASVILLAVIALPTAQLRTALPDGNQEAYGSSAQRAYEVTSERFGGGFNGPILALVHLPEGLSEDQAQNKLLDVADRLRQADGVVAVMPAATNDDRSYGAIQIVPTDGPSSASTEKLVHELREQTPGIGADTNTTVALTGQVTAQIDVSEKLADALPLYLGIVVGLSLILLLLVFRSIVVPLLATAGFLLSLAAAFGATVAVYQWGWFGPVFDIHVTGPIMSFLPILLTGILFGLAMDYQVFLVSAMREAYAHGADPREAVKAGFRSSAPVVTAAALIMTSVFAGFIFSHLAMIRPIGFALAVGVLADAFVVRMTLTPAVMTLLGKHAWYIPTWLDRILPDVDVEGAKLLKDHADAEHHAAAEPSGGDGDRRDEGALAGASR